MSDYITFEATLEPMPWGDSTYTVLRLPPNVMAALGKAKRVEGEMNEHPVNLAITRAPVLDDPFLYAGKSLQQRADLEPGVPFEARLRPADPNLVEVPADILRALRSTGKSESWDALSPGKKRGLIHQVETAKRAETRIKRITTLVKDLT